MTAATSLPDAQSRSQGIALRRDLTMLGMTLVVPGSAQLVAGNERLGRLAVRIWLTLIALAVVFVLLLVVPFTRAFALGLYANPISLEVLRWAIGGLRWVIKVLRWAVGHGQHENAPTAI